MPQLYIVPQVPSPTLFDKKMAQRCGIWQIKPLASLEQKQLSVKSNNSGFKSYSSFCDLSKNLIVFVESRLSVLKSDQWEASCQPPWSSDQSEAADRPIRGRQLTNQRPLTDQSEDITSFWTNKRLLKLNKTRDRKYFCFNRIHHFYTNKHYCIVGLRAIAKRRLLNRIELIWFLSSLNIFWTVVCRLDYCHLHYCRLDTVV